MPRTLTLVMGIFGVPSLAKGIRTPPTTILFSLHGRYSTPIVGCVGSTYPPCVTMSTCPKYCPSRLALFER